MVRIVKDGPAAIIAICWSAFGAGTMSIDANLATIKKTVQKVHTLLLTLLDETFGGTHYYSFKNSKLIDVHKRGYDGGPTQWRAVFTGKIKDVTCGKV